MTGGLAGLVGNAMPTGLWWATLLQVMTTVLGGLVAIATCASLALREGHGILPARELHSSVRRFTAGIFLITTLLVVVAYLLLSSGIDMTMNSAEATPHREESARYFVLGLLGVSGGIFATLMVNPLWVPLVTQQEMSFSELRVSGVMLMSKSRQAWTAMLVVALLCGFSNSVLPAIAGAALTVLHIAWLYVAAREIYGGISGNARFSEAEASLTEA